MSQKKTVHLVYVLSFFMLVMIPILPEGMDTFQTLKFYDTLSGNLSDQSSIHTNWHTHRGNPSVCWICDMTTLLSRVLELAMSKYTKSTVDIETDEEQCETDSESEIEFSNVDDEGDVEPEYDTVESK